MYVTLDALWYMHELIFIMNLRWYKISIFIAGIISQEPEKVPQTYILYLLCRLNDGENYLNKYSEESTLTVLEDAAEILEIFLTNVKQSFQKEGKDLLRAVKEEVEIELTQQHYLQNLELSLLRRYGTPDNIYKD